MFGFVLCADDYAMTAGVSRGILQLIEAGRLTATSAMTNRPHWGVFARELVPFSADIDIGLHLNLTCAAPLTAMPRFAPGGTLPGLTEVIKAGLTFRLPVLEVITEINAQLDLFEAAMGRAPDFIDGHQHVHALPGVRDLLMVVIERRYKTVKPYIRLSGDTVARILRRQQFASKALKVKLLGAGFAKRLAKAGFRTNDGFAGFSGFDPAASYADQFDRYLAAPGPRHLVMCHPGLADDELRGLDPVVTVRERELEFLAGPGFERAMTVAGAKLRRMPV